VQSQKVENIFSFKESFEKQKPYAELFEIWLSQRENVINVEKATQANERQGIDYIITNNDNQVFNIQLKTDFLADKTGNILFEVISQAYKDRASVIGAEFNMPNADYIFYLFLPSGDLLCFKFRVLLDYVIENYNTFQNRAIANDNYGIKYKTLCLLIPVSQIKHLITHKGNLSEVSSQ
jgi:hypothetical protein